MLENGMPQTGSELAHRLKLIVKSILVFHLQRRDGIWKFGK